VPEIQGHRGTRALRPENTLPGLARALALGVDALEFDVTLTSGAGLILAHDLVVEAQTMATPARLAAATSSSLTSASAGHSSRSPR
jgi:glycerophosphoryl diester phosphodiesterase